MLHVTILLFLILPQHIAINKIINTVIYFDFPAYIFFNYLLNIMHMHEHSTVHRDHFHANKPT